MNKILPLAALFVFVLIGCSSVETQKVSLPLSSIQQSEKIQLLVRTGNSVMDKLVYEMAYQQFSDILPLREKEPFTGVMEITFVSSGQSAFIGSSSTIGSATAYGSGWYSRNGYVGGSAVVSGSSTTISSGGTFTWQNSTMLIVLKKSDGERLWTADYNYKGGWEMSGWVVNTPDEAAHLVLKRLKEKFQSDFTQP
jgi:hypothetical protein